MTNTLTSSFKPIQLPKLNTNLVGVISLIVFCTMAFLVISAIADDCENEWQQFLTAALAHAQATQNYQDAQETLTEALISENPELIQAATEWLRKCRIAKKEARQALDNASEAYFNCVGSDSGSCG